MKQGLKPQKGMTKFRVLPERNLSTTVHFCIVIDIVIVINILVVILNVFFKIYIAILF